MNFDEFLVEDYKVKVNYLSQHHQRVWTRFNFFVTFQSGLVAALALTLDEGSFSDSSVYLLMAEAALSAIWWVFGAQDEDPGLNPRCSKIGIREIE